VPSGKLEMTVTKAINLEEEKMMINKSLNATEMTVALAGRLDTTTAPQLEAELKISLNGVDSLVMDFAELDYISSAGLRVLLSTQKMMNKQGKMVIRHPNETILEVLEVTGFTAIMTIE
jgi:anti-sigma B factor antagonist